MGREGTETLLDTLFIADIGKDVLKDSQLGSLKGRNMEAGLSHKGKKSYGFQGNGFTAGVWACDDEKIKVFSKPDVDGNHLFWIQKRMAAVFDMDVPLVVEFWLYTVVPAGQGCLGKNKVQPGQNRKVFQNGVEVGGQLSGEGGQDTFDLSFFLNFQLPQFVV